MRTRLNSSNNNGHSPDRRPKTLSSSLTTPGVRTLVIEAYAFIDDETEEDRIGIEISTAQAAESRVTTEGVRIGFIITPGTGEGPESTIDWRLDGDTIFREVTADWPREEDDQRLQAVIAELSETVKFWQQAEVIREQARRKRTDPSCQVRRPTTHQELL